VRPVANPRTTVGINVDLTTSPIADEDDQKRPARDLSHHLMMLARVDPGTRRREETGMGGCRLDSVAIAVAKLDKVVANDSLGRPLPRLDQLIEHTGHAGCRMQKEISTERGELDSGAHEQRGCVQRAARNNYFLCVDGDRVLNRAISVNSTCRDYRNMAVRNANSIRLAPRNH